MDIENKEVWDNIKNGRILNIFQFDSAVGAQAAKRIAPSSMVELSDANGLMRLMTAEKGAETPMDKYIRFKNNIKLWYDEMKAAHLTDSEMKTLEPYFKSSYGVPPSQEQLMMMLMDEDICNFSLAEANTARKIVGKKQMSKIPELKEKVLKQASSAMLGKYVWECGIGPQMGYSFSVIHATAYSFIGYQTAYMATKWNPIYWDTACLVVNSGSLEDDNDYEIDEEDVKKKEKGVDYAKLAKAIGDITSKGIEVSLVNINSSDYGFKPDVEHNRILYGLKALSNINGDIIDQIKANRPYEGIKDFMIRVPIKKLAMINLIKAGAFDEIDKYLNNRKEIMTYYISQISEPKKRLTLQNFNGLILHGLIPKEMELQIRVFNFNKYLKASCKSGENFLFNDTCIQFLEKFMPEVMNSTITIEDKVGINQKVWDGVYQSHMDVVRAWIKNNYDELLTKYNDMLFMETWEKYAGGTQSSWEMDSLCFYHGEHELAHIDMRKYNIADFNQLMSGEVDYIFKRGNHQIPIYKLYRIIGTVISKDDNRHSIFLLTPTGVVNVKFTGDYYAMFKKQVSQVQIDGTKKILEKSWFKRGTKLMVTGFRRDDQLVGKTYAQTPGHQLYKITDILGSDIKLQHERVTSSGTIEEDEYEE